MPMVRGSKFREDYDKRPYKDANEENERVKYEHSTRRNDNAFIICPTYCTGTSWILSLNFSHAFIFFAGKITRLNPVLIHSFTRLSA